MELLFTIQAGQSQVGDSNFRDHYPHVNSNMSWKDFEVDIRKVTRDIIIPAITSEFYSDIAGKYKADTLTPDEQDIVELLQDCIASYTIWKISPKKNLTIGDMGMQENNGKDGSNSAVSTWRYYHHYWTVMKEADVLLDKILMELEIGGDKFPKFKAAKAGLIVNDLFIRHTTDYEQFVFLNHSRRTFLKLIPSIRMADRRYIAPLIGDAQYAELLKNINSGNLSAEEKLLLKKIQEVLAHYALFLAIPHLAVLIENNGIMVLSSTDGMNTKQMAHKEQVINLTQRAEADGKIALSHLTDFLYINEDTYPLWKNSEAYQTFDGRSGLPQSWGDGGVFLG